MISGINISLHTEKQHFYPYRRDTIDHPCQKGIYGDTIRVYEKIDYLRKNTVEAGDVMIYKGENLKEISFPLGGIGSGCIGLAGNGQLVDWEIFGRPNKQTLNGYSHFAVRCFDEKGIKDARVLVSDTENDLSGKGLGFGSGVSGFSMNGFPHFKENTFDGEFPEATLVFEDEKFPAKISLKAFNPFIPLDSDNSSIPAAFFEIQFENTSDKQLTFEAALSITNPFGATVNTVTENGVILYDSQNRQKNMTILTDCEKPYITDYWYRGWWGSFYKDNIRAFWNDWSEGNELKCRNYTEAAVGDIASVSGRMDIPSGEKKTIRFVLSWSIPACINFWNPIKNADGGDVTWKNYYATIFETSHASATYSIQNWDELYNKTVQFKESLYSTTMDESFKQAIGAGLSVLKSPTVLRLEDGSLYGFEGVGTNIGSCEGLCQHVWNYAYVCCYLFPDLEKGIRNNELTYGVLDSGETVFRLNLPFDRKDFVNLFAGNDGTKFRPALDGQMGDIIKTYREWKLSGDDAWLKGHWDTLKKVLDFAFSPENDQHWDEDCDGILDGRQHHTLDIEIFGASAWLEGFYLGALKCAAEIAEHLADNESAEKYNRLFKNGYAYTKNSLFNGEYFIQKIDLKDKAPVDRYHCADLLWNEEYNELSHQIGEGCFIDQLCGQWHSILCGFEKPFDDQQAKIAVLNIYKNNFKTSMRDLPNPWRLFALNDEGGTVMCTYPEGSTKPAMPIAYCEEVMSGFEYAFAGLLVYYGYIEEAIQVVKTVRDRYTGANRNPFNDIECGSNYARSMASFALIPILSGFRADLPNHTLTFDPKVKNKPFQSIWSVATGWGEFKATDDSIVIHICSGSIRLQALHLPFIKSIQELSIDGENVKYTFERGILNFETVDVYKNMVISLNQ